MKKIDYRILLLLISNVFSAIFITIIIDEVTLTTLLQKIFVFVYFYVLLNIGTILLIGKRKNIWKLWIISAMMAFCIVMVEEYDSYTKIGKIELTPMGKTNGLSSGEEIWIKEIWVDGVEYDKRKISDASGWYIDEISNSLVSFNEPKTESIKLEIKYRKEVKVVFIAHQWSGGVKINFNGEESECDLYANKGRNLEKIFSSIRGEKAFNIINLLVILGSWIFFTELWYVFCYWGLLKGLMVFANKLWIDLRCYLMKWRNGRSYECKSDSYIKFIILILVTLIFSYTSIVVNNSKVNEMLEPDWNNVSLSPQLVEGVEIVQNVKINGDTKRLAIVFATYERRNEGSIQVDIEQEDRIIYSKTIDVSALKDWEKYYLDIPKIQENSYQIILKGIDSQLGKAVSVFIVEQNLFGKLNINNEFQNGNLFLSLDTEFVPRLHIIRIILLIILIIVITYAVYIFYQEENRNNSIKLYICAFLIILIGICIRSPMFSLTPEAFYETASNFYKVTYEQGFLGSLFVTDAGYWPLFQRLISDFVILFLGQSKYAIYLMQWIAILFVSAVCSRFCLYMYNEYFDKNIRFAVCILLGAGCSVVNSETVAFINFSYIGIVLVLLNFLIDFNKLNKMQYIYILFSSIVVISKGHYVVLLPIMLLVIVLILKKKEFFRLKIYCTFIVIGTFLQSLYMYRYMEEWVEKDVPLFTKLIEALKNGIYYFVQSIIAMALPYQQDIEFNGWVINSIVIVFIISFFLYLLKTYKQQKSKDVIYICLCLLMAFGASLLNSMVIDEFKQCNWGITKSLNIFRQTIFVITGVMFAFILSFKLIEEKRRNYLISLALLFLMIRFATVFPWVPETYYEWGNWENYHTQFENDSYVIPITADRFISKNASILYVGNRTDIDVSKWNFTTGIDENIEYECAYSTCSIYENLNTDNQKIISIYANKVCVTQRDDIEVILYDKNGQEILRKKVMPLKQRRSVGFVFDEPVVGVNRIKFVDSAGENYEMSVGIYIGIANQM